MLPTNKLIIGIYIICILLSGNVSGEVMEINKDATKTFSPRQFCHNTGGSINETADTNQYICCYEEKCLLIDTKQGLSTILEPN